MRHKFGQRPGETDTEYRERLDLQSAEERSKGDRRLAEEKDTD